MFHSCRLWLQVLYLTMVQSRPLFRRYFSDCRNTLQRLQSMGKMCEVDSVLAARALSTSSVWLRLTTSFCVSTLPNKLRMIYPANVQSTHSSFAKHNRQAQVALI